MSVKKIIKRLLKKKLSEAQIKDIQEVSEKTGWTFEEAKKAMRSAKENYETLFMNYAKYELFRYEKEELEEISAIVNKKSKKRRMIELVVVKSDYSYGEALYQMLLTSKKYGYTFEEFYKNYLYEVPLEERKEKYEKETTARKKAIRENREHYIGLLKEKTGWEDAFARKQVREAKERTGCTAEEYFLYKFYEMTEEEQQNVFVSKVSKNITRKYNVNREFVNILYDKELSNQYFDKYIGRKWCVNTKISEDEFVEKFKACKRVFYKPLKGHHGEGVKPFDITEDTIRDVYKELATYRIGVVEEYITQHHKMNELAPSAVGSIRVCTISSNDKPVLEGGGNLEIVYTSLKMAGKDSIVDNLVGGGLLAGIDMETGKLCTNAADDQGNFYENHPGTGMKIKGFEVPYYKEAMEMVRAIYEDKKMEGYLGWDVALTENGPVLIEMNTVPGVILFQLAYMEEKQGMVPYMKKYF